MGLAGLLGTAREVLTEYKADVSEHVAALDELEGAEAEMAAAEKEQAEARAEQAQTFIGDLVKVTLAVTALKEAGEFVMDGYNDSVKEARLESAAAGVDIDALSKSAGGLKTNMELLEFAAKANSSAFKNTQQDMEDGERAMRALEARGVPAQQAFDAITGSMDNLKTRGLQALGVYVDTTKVSFDANGEAIGSYNQKLEQHEKIMESVRALAGGVSDAQDNVGDSMKRTEVKLSDSWDDLKKALGSLAESMQPVIEGLAKISKGLAALMKDRGSFRGSELEKELGFDDESYYARMQNGGQIAAEGGNTTAALLNMAGGFGAFGDLMTPLDATDMISAPAAAQRKEASAAARPQVAERLRVVTKPDVDMGGEEMNVSSEVKAALKADRDAYALQLGQQILASAYVAANDNGGDALHPRLVTARDGSSKLLGPAGTTGLGVAALTGPGGTDGSADRIGDTKGGFQAGNEQAILDDIQKQAAAAQKLQFAQGETMLSKTFGKVGELDLYKKGFDALTSTVGTMYDAIVTGSEPAAQAIRKAIGASVEAVGKQMAIESLKEAAYAIGDLAIGNFPGAASHATAAAEFAAGAVVAGVVARELGAGGSTTSTGGSSGSAAPASSTAANSNSATSNATNQNGAIIVIGDRFANDTPRMRQVKAQQLVNLATGASPGVKSG